MGILGSNGVCGSGTLGGPSPGPPRPAQAPPPGRPAPPPGPPPPFLPLSLSFPPPERGFSLPPEHGRPGLRLDLGGGRGGRRRGSERRGRRRWRGRRPGGRGRGGGRGGGGAAQRAAGADPARPARPWGGRTRRRGVGAAAPLRGTLSPSLHSRPRRGWGRGRPLETRLGARLSLRSRSPFCDPRPPRAPLMNAWKPGICLSLGPPALAQPGALAGDPGPP